MVLFLMNKKWISRASNCEVYTFFEDVSSNHRIVIAKIQLSLRRNVVQTTTTAHYDWSLLNTKDISDKYTLTLRNKFNALQEISALGAPFIWPCATSKQKA